MALRPAPEIREAVGDDAVNAELTHDLHHGAGHVHDHDTDVLSEDAAAELVAFLA